MAFTENELMVVDLFVAAYGRAPTKEGLDFFVGKLDSGEMTAKQIAEYMLDPVNNPEAATRYPSTATTEEKINTVFHHVLGREVATTEGMDFWKAKVDGDNGYTLADLVFDVIQAAKSQSVDALTLQNKEDVVEYFLESVPVDNQAGNQITTDTITSDPATVEAVKEEIKDLIPPVQGQVIPLTAGIDYKDGTDGDDIFDGSVNTNGVATLNSADRLDGKAGDDVLVASLTGGATIAPTLSNIEKVQIISSGALANTFNMINASGVDSIEVKNSSTGTTVQNIGSADIDVSIVDQNSAVTFSYINSALAGDTNLEVTLNGTQPASTLSVVQQAGIDTSGVETLTLNSIGGNTNFLTTATAVNGAGASTVNKLVVTGSDNLNITTALNASVADVDASELVGGLTASFLNTASDMTIKGGEGKDSITLTANTGNVTVDMGKGDDTFAFTTTATFNSLDTIDGGEGTNTLGVRAVDAEAITATLTNVTNIQKLGLTTAGTAGAAINATYFGDISSVGLIGGTVGAYNVTMGAGEKTLSIADATRNSTLGGALTVTDTGTASDDVLNIVNSNSGSATDTFAGRNITSNGYETVNIDTGSNATPIAQTIGTIAVNADSTSNANTINLSGVNGVTVAGVRSNGSGLFTIDASGLTGSATLVMTTAPARTGGVTGDVKIVGSDNISNAAGTGDTLLGSTTEKNTIDAGAGNDTVTGGALDDTINLGDGNDILNASTGNDVIDGGAGNDTITAGIGEQTIKGGVGDDTIIVGGTASASDVFDGGDGNDTLRLSAAVTASVAANITNFETLSLSATATQDMIQFTNNSGFTTLEAAGAASFTYTNVSASTNTINVSDFAAGADNVTLIKLARLVDTSSDSVTINASGTASATTIAGATNIATVTVNDEETISLNSGENVAETLNITTLNANDVKDMTLAGTGAITITTLNGASNLATVDASGLKGGATVNAGNSTADMTIKGSLSGVNNLTGGTGADSITGGALADTLTGGNGNDTIDGGAGNDILKGGLADDTINGGIGNDIITGGAGDDNLTGGLGNDTFVLSAVNGIDTINDFVVANDSIRVSAAGDILGAAIAGSTVITAAGAATGASITATDNQVFYISANGAAGNLTTTGTATLTTTDLTATTLTAVANYLGEYFNGASAANTNDVMVALNWTAGGSNDTYLYHITNDNVANALQAAEIEYVGVVHHDVGNVLTTGDFI